MASDSAASRVFAIDELLENILLYLSINHLLTAKRVSHQFFRLISGSPSLQRILFARADLNRPLREHNPLFEDYFVDIACDDDVTPPKDEEKPPPALLKISPISMRKLIHRCPKEWRTMSMFQPPCPYWLTLESASIFVINVKFLNDANVPIMRAVEKANWIVEMEAEKKRRARSNLEQTMRGNFARVVNRRLVRDGETVTA